MKRTFILLLAGFVVAGCGGDDTVATDPAGPAAVKPDVEIDGKKPAAGNQQLSLNPLFQKEKGK
ncbi:MAG: hypothetical protein WAO58_03495 [Fimbriimonadaceae bacterium]